MTAIKTLSNVMLQPCYGRSPMTIMIFNRGGHSVGLSMTHFDWISVTVCSHETIMCERILTILSSFIYFRYTSTQLNDVILGAFSHQAQLCHTMHGHDCSPFLSAPLVCSRWRYVHKVCKPASKKKEEATILDCNCLCPILQATLFFCLLFSRCR